MRKAFLNGGRGGGGRGGGGGAAHQKIDNPMDRVRSARKMCDTSLNKRRSNLKSSPKIFNEIEKELLGIFFLLPRFFLFFLFRFSFSLRRYEGTTAVGLT